MILGKNMTTTLTLLAKVRSEGEFVAFLVVMGFFIGFGLFMILGQSNAHYDVTTKRGVPYCPKCNRQVTYRRDYCRCCGYQFVSYKKKD